MPQNSSNNEVESLDDLLSSLNKNYLIDSVSEVNNSYKSKVKYNLRRKIFGEYSDKSNSFRINLVKLINKLAKLVKFQKIILKDETEILVKSLKQEIELKFSEKITTLEKLIVEQENKVNLLKTEVKNSAEIIIGLESILSNINKSNNINIDNSINNSNTEELININSDLNYLLLENRYRGSEELIKNRLSSYIDVIKTNSNPSLLNSKTFIEIGSGRGEFLELLNENGIKSIGIEPDSGMYQYSIGKGLNTIKNDALSYLMKLEDNSISGISAFQVIEHLPLEYLKLLLTEIKRVLVKEGIVILETINTAQILPLCHNYFRDPTHQQPIHPETIKFLVESGGLKVKEVIYSSNYPKEATIQEIDLQEEYPLRYKELVNQLNSRISIINNILYGAQDYAVLAVKE